MRRFVLFIELCLLFVSANAYSITLTSVYLGRQNVKSGALIAVDKHHFWLMDTNGELVKLSRHDVFGLATYQFSRLPFTVLNFAESEVPLYSFETFYAGERKTLGRGWPIGFDPNTIQLLTTEGTELVISRDAIWGINKDSFKGSIVVENAQEQTVLLKNPLPFADYPEIKLGNKGNRLVILPRDNFQDPLSIKKFFDKLEADYKEIDSYYDKQRFYALPHYYSRRTYLGTWYLVGGRNVQAGSRRVNFVPYVQTSSHSGPFSYQYEIISGVSPRTWGVDFEPMTQISFAMKDSYFAFDAFFDPTNILLGSSYKWRPNDLGPVDARLISPSGGRVGIDWKYVAVQFGFLGVLHGMRLNDYFDYAQVSYPVVTFSARLDKWFFELTQIGSDFDMNGRWRFAHLGGTLRFPLEDHMDLDFRYSFHSLKLINNNNSRSLEKFNESNHDLTSLTSYHLDNRWRIQNLIILSRQKVEGYQGKSLFDKNKTYLKFGLGGALYF